MTAKKTSAKAHRVYDAFVTAALEYGFSDEEITVGDDGTEIFLLLERDERSGSTRVAKEGISRSNRALTDLADRAVRQLTSLMPAVSLVADGDGE